MISSFLQISSSFDEIHWFFYDLKADMNFNDFSRAVGTLNGTFNFMISSTGSLDADNLLVNVNTQKC